MLMHLIKYSLSRIDKKDLLFCQLMITLCGLPLHCYVDSVKFSQWFAYGQSLSNLNAIACFTMLYHSADQKLRTLMLIVVVLSFCGEIDASIIIGLYDYRLHNVPVYVPLGHAVVYAIVYHLQRQPFMLCHQRIIIPLLLISAFCLCTYTFFVHQDVFGFACFLFFLYLLRTKQNKLFYVLMFWVIVYVERLGTYFGCWAWYGQTGKLAGFIHTYNPPMGIAGLYMILDLMANTSYLYIRLDRFRSINQMKQLIIKQFR